LGFISAARVLKIIGNGGINAYSNPLPSLFFGCAAIHEILILGMLAPDLKCCPTQAVRNSGFCQLRLLLCIFIHPIDTCQFYIHEDSSISLQFISTIPSLDAMKSLCLISMILKWTTVCPTLYFYYVL
jgi:hypothetical protein